MIAGYTDAESMCRMVIANQAVKAQNRLGIQVRVSTRTRQVTIQGEVFFTPIGNTVEHAVAIIVSIVSVVSVVSVASVTIYQGFSIVSIEPWGVCYWRMDAEQQALPNVIRASQGDQGGVEDLSKRQIRLIKVDKATQKVTSSDRK